MTKEQLEEIISRIDKTLSYITYEVPFLSILGPVCQRAGGVTWQDLAAIRIALSTIEQEKP